VLVDVLVEVRVTGTHDGDGLVVVGALDDGADDGDAAGLVTGGAGVTLAVGLALGVPDEVGDAVGEPDALGEVDGVPVPDTTRVTGGEADGAWSLA
jgi:hypothetical protein